MQNMLILDRREKKLSNALMAMPHEVRELPVGDIVCQYQNGCNWIAERKTAADLAASMISGRLTDQTARLHTSNYYRIFWLIEGSLEGHTVPHKSLVGACVDMSLRQNSVLLRTASVEETAGVIVQLVSKAASTPGVPHAFGPAAPLSKRKRDADKHLIYLRMLQCVPSVSERVARRIADHFPTFALLQQGLECQGKFPDIRLDGGSHLGATRINTLRGLLCDVESGVSKSSKQSSPG